VCVHSKLGVTPSVVTSPVGYPSTGCLGLVPVQEYRRGTDTGRRTSPQLVLFQCLTLGFSTRAPKGVRLGPAAVLQVERQLGLSPVAARLRGVLVSFVRVKESRKTRVLPLVQVIVIVESGPRHQQIDIPCEASARLREAMSCRARYWVNGPERRGPSQLVLEQKGYKWLIEEIGEVEVMMMSRERPRSK
ncbi:hypothetical protein Taro_030454, partial [Colocasia esculenta]|nr:hypothetical protein [Colocasia esculenta]